MRRTKRNPAPTIDLAPIIDVDGLAPIATVNGKPPTEDHRLLLEDCAELVALLRGDGTRGPIHISGSLGPYPRGGRSVAVYTLSDDASDVSWELNTPVPARGQGAARMFVDPAGVLFSLGAGGSIRRPFVSAAPGELIHLASAAGIAGAKAEGNQSPVVEGCVRAAHAFAGSAS